MKYGNKKLTRHHLVLEFIKFSILNFTSKFSNIDSLFEMPNFLNIDARSLKSLDTTLDTLK